MVGLVVAALAAVIYLGVVVRRAEGPIRLVKVVPAGSLAVAIFPHSVGLGAAFLFYALGDLLLLDKGKLFLAGLGAFLVGHLWFVGATLAAVSPLLLGFGAGVALTMCVALWPGLHGPLKVAVPIYAMALVGLLVAATALGPVATAGALVFLLSDAILALQRFRRISVGGDLAVMVTYYAALGLLALPTLVPPGS